ncbi:MAG TPA: NUDIX domain-containing protein [Stellaceae bacterium]|nr:NUDIX domain-containing protein [Stellaceae bacterium]
MAKQSAGVLLYRFRRTVPEVFLVHPGGPFWAKKDAGAWSIPKGEAAPGEDLLTRAQREFAEETGFAIAGEFRPLTPIRQSGGKVVYAWAIEGDCDAGAVKSNTFDLEWPPRSGRVRAFPEVDRAQWFGFAAARAKINPAQRGLIDELERLLSR